MIKTTATISGLALEAQTTVQEHLPGADIVYDKFHIVANYNEAIDQIRRREWRQAEGL